MGHTAGSASEGTSFTHLLCSSSRKNHVGMVNAPSHLSPSTCYKPQEEMPVIEQ